MVILIDLKEKRHLVSQNYRMAWQKMCAKWWIDMYEKEREFAFEKLYGVTLPEFYTVLNEGFPKDEGIADTIERSVAYMVMESHPLKDKDYADLFETLEDIYLIEIKEGDFCKRPAEKPAISDVPYF